MKERQYVYIEYIETTICKKERVQVKISKNNSKLKENGREKEIRKI